ncbi:MAG: hypothetical protein N2442_06210, partial [Spirochaetes bacterium]|nr:hypothetical protein [Spirochaetota bacterium]
MRNRIATPLLVCVCFLALLAHCATDHEPSLTYPSTRKQVTVNGNTCFRPSLAYSGSNYCAAWQGKFDYGGLDMEIGYSLFKLQDPIPFVNAYIVAKGDSEAPKVLWNGSNFWLCWGNYPVGIQLYHEIYLARINDQSNVTVFRITNTGNSTTLNRFPSFCWTGTEFGVAWMQTNTQENYTSSTIFFTRVDSNGGKKAADIQITSLGIAEYPSLVWNGTEYGLCYQDVRNGNKEIYFLRLDSMGNKIGGEMRITEVDGDSEHPCLRWNGTGYALAWNDNRTGHHQIYITFLDSSGKKKSSDIQITTAPGCSWYPVLAWCDGTYALIWHDNRSGNFDVYMTYLDSNGKRLAEDKQLTGTHSDNWSPNH